MIREPKKHPKTSAVDMAVRAIEESRRSLDINVGDVDSAPTILDLPHGERHELCSRCGHPNEKRCPECGSPLCDECVG